MVALDFDDMRPFANDEWPGLDPALALPLLELRHGHDYLHAILASTSNNLK
jgi:hypothetical protein